jgi:hypothetical protein
MGARSEKSSGQMGDASGAVALLFCFGLTRCGRPFYSPFRTNVRLTHERRREMLGFIVLAAWMAFVAGYLIWQQMSGDLSEAASRRPLAISRQLSAVSSRRIEAIPVGAELPDDVRESLVYRPASLTATVARRAG